MPKLPEMKSFENDICPNQSTHAYIISPHTSMYNYKQKGYVSWTYLKRNKDWISSFDNVSNDTNYHSFSCKIIILWFAWCECENNSWLIAEGPQAELSFKLSHFCSGT